jgi:hypothetical protein
VRSNWQRLVSSTRQRNRLHLRQFSAPLRAVSRSQLAATLDEPWTVVFDLLDGIEPGLIVVDGEEELSILAERHFAAVPRQRCLWHLAVGTFKAARYRDKRSKTVAEDLRRRLEALLLAAYRDRDHEAASRAFEDLIDHAEAVGASAAASHLRSARSEVFTFLIHPGAGRLVFGHKGRPELGTGVLERVMREMNRRTDVGVRWSIPGVRAILMVKLQRKYGHGPWSPTPVAEPQSQVRFSLVA